MVYKLINLRQENLQSRLTIKYTSATMEVENAHIITYINYFPFRIRPNLDISAVQSLQKLRTVVKQNIDAKIYNRLERNLIL